MQNNITFTSKVKMLTHNYSGAAISKKEAIKLRNAFKILENNHNNDTVYFYRGQCGDSEPFYELTVVEKRGDSLYAASAGKIQGSNDKSIVTELYQMAKEKAKPSKEKYLLKYYV